MRLRTILRVSPGAWLSLPMVLLSLLYVVMFQSRIRADPYPLAVTSTALATLGFIVPIVAALGAWEGGRLRRADWWALPHVRPRAAIAAWALAPIVATGVAAVSAGVLANLFAVDLLFPDPRPVAVAGVVLVAHALAGFSLGLAVPVVVAAPAALLTSFVWMVFLRAIEPIWLRHLNGGALELCCGRHEELAPAAVVGALTVALGLAASSITFLTLRRSRRRDLLVPLPLLIGLVVGSMMVSSLGSQPTMARDRSALLCDSPSSSVTVCVWPEHVDRLQEVGSIAEKAARGWRAVGLQVPPTFAEGPPETTPAGVLPFGFSRASDPSDIVSGLAYAMLPAWPACADRGPYLGYDAFDYVHAWFATTGGMSDEEIERRFGDLQARGAATIPVVLAKVRALPVEEQLAWVADNVAALEACDRPPRLTV